MPPRLLAYVLGLCNLGAGALLISGPQLAVPLDGAQSPAASLLGRAAGTLLVAIAAGAWWLPRNALSSYLWLFGVGAKIAGVVLWASAALSFESPALWLGAGVDLVVAVMVTTGLLRAR